MKIVIISFIMLLTFIPVVQAKSVTVYDHSTGEYRQYDVNQRGRNVEVYDWKTNEYRYLDMDRSGNVYDCKANKFYGVDMDRNGKGGTECKIQTIISE